MDKQELTLDGTRYTICLPDVATDYIQGKIAETKQPYELEMLRDMASRLQPGDLVLDVGANIGNHSLYLASVTGCRVEAFEPNQALCKALQASIALNNLGERLTVHQVGVADADGFAHFNHVDDSNLGAQSLEVSQDADEIKLISLDQLDLPASVRMIKIDVEGMELQVLSGAREVIEKDHPILYIEGQTEEEFSLISSVVRDLGYLYCSTFNATPTHLFLHKSEFSDLTEIDGYLAEKAHLGYRNNRNLAELRSILHSCNVKYKELNERFSELKERYQEANHKYRDVSGKVNNLKNELEKLNLAYKEAEFEKAKLLDERALEQGKAELEWERERTRYQAQFDRLILEKQHAQQHVNQLQVQLEHMQSQYQQLNSEYELLLKSSEASRLELQQEKQESESWLHRARQKRELLDKHFLDFKEVSSGKTQVEQKLSQTEAQLERLQEQYRWLNDEHEALQHKGNTITQQAHRDKLNIEIQLRKTQKLLAEKNNKISQITGDKERAEQAVNQLHEKLQILQAELEGSDSAYGELQTRKQARLKQLNRANSKYRQLTSETIPTLKQKLEAQTQRSSELYQRAEQLNQELKQARQLQAEAQRALSAIRSSATYKAGLHVRAASSSFGAALKLPVRLWRLRKAKSNAPAVPASQSPETMLVSAAQAADRKALFIEGLTQKPTRQIRVACIMDDFTFGSYQPECDLHQLTPDSWESELEACKPELLFIESAWRGKDELWGSKVGHCSQELQGIVAWCRERHVPTVFWNKEDPVHFETFLTTAKLFDFVFTTDMDCIHRYKAALGHDQVFFLPFACQPKVHNPIEKYVRKDAFCFAGAYYVRYPERTRDLESFVQELPGYRPLEIYDRNFGKDDPNYQFPEAYQPYIVGTLPFTEIDKAYKGYRYAINLNSIKQSQTMFARRVYELLGSNTLTISNYSRGVRLMFGDLVVTSDSGPDIKRRLEQLQSVNQIDRLRLAGLRKVMAEHTYADRLNYLLERVTGKERPLELPSFAVLATAKNMDEVKCIAAHVARQQGVELSLTLVLRRGVSVADAESELQGLGCPYVVMQARALRRKNLLELAGSDQHWIAAMMPSDYYGPHYLLDMALATRYSKASVIGKAAWHLFTEEEGNSQVSLHNAEEAYTPARHLHARCSVLAPQLAREIRSDKWLANLNDWQYDQPEQLSIDPYNYCQNVDSTHWSEVARQVDDLAVDTGIKLSQLTNLAEQVEPMEKGVSNAPGLNGNQLAQLLKGNGLNTGNQEALDLDDGPIRLTRNKAIHTGITGATLDIESSLSDGKHEYLYAAKDLAVADVQRLADDRLTIPMHLEVDPGLNLTLVVLFLDDNKARLSHQMLLPNRNVQLDIPADAAFLRVGLRVYASGSSRIKRLMLGHLDLEPVNILGQSDVLLLTNHYPSYDDLYRNGFVHSRVKAYAERDVAVDVFRLRKDEPISWHEFQDVDVTTGSQQALRRMLQSGRYRHILVHFLDPDMWDVLKDFIDTIKVTVWVHGAEIHPWYRRKFNIETPEQEEKAKAQSEVRMAFWKELLQPMPANLHMVFVSNSFAQEVMEDLGSSLPENQYSVIHNPIDTELFSYEKKDPEQRKKILSIRPFATRQYANDISVKCILELSNKEFFNELEFTIIGDGALFDSTLEPLRDFDNVKIERRFVTHAEIAALHKTHGLFLCPSRWDSQGVSRDEAMASGLVPLTTAIAAISEFVDDSCAVLAHSEDHIGLAEGVELLYEQPTTFLYMSRNASTRVLGQSEKFKITSQEVGLMKKVAQAQAQEGKV